MYWRPCTIAGRDAAARSAPNLAPRNAAWAGRAPDVELEQCTFAPRLNAHSLRIEAMRLNGQRFLTKQLKGEPLGSETSINKLHRAELEVEMGELAMEILGSGATLMETDAPEGGAWARFALNWPEVVIGGGTPNIQKNIIAERILGLPKD